MKFLKGFLPNISIALSVSMLVVLYLDMRNPMMGFLRGAPFLTLAVLTLVCAITNAVVLYVDYRKPVNESHKKNTAEIAEIEQDEIDFPLEIQ